jgi:chemotaxis protein MotB
MARKKKAEEHVNHEAWVIPYADFITLLLAFFVVMYALSSINEGKYRVLAESLSAAFNGTPKTMEPVQVGDHPVRSTAHGAPDIRPESPGNAQPVPRVSVPLPDHRPVPDRVKLDAKEKKSDATRKNEAKTAAAAAGLTKIADKIEHAIAPLIKKHLVIVRRNKNWLEVEIKTDILFPSGVARLSRHALPILDKLGKILERFPNPIRIEGYTDNIPIHTRRFPSNWELSAGRAASVARLLAGRGIDPGRLAIIGWSEFHPVADNSTAKGRNRNRRVTLVILGDSKVPARFYSDDKVVDNSSKQPLQGQADAHLGSS